MSMFIDVIKEEENKIVLSFLKKFPESKDVTTWVIPINIEEAKRLLETLNRVLS